MYTSQTRIIFLMLFMAVWCNACKMKETPSPPATTNTDVVVTEKQSIAKKLRENAHLPVEERIALYRKLKKENSDAYNFDNEYEITMYGYGLFWEGKTDEAIAVFALIIEEFGSANSYDSMGEALLAKGDKEKSLAHYRKSLEMNPDNFNAEDQIERILHPEKIPETPAQKFNKVYTVNQYKADLDLLGKKLLEIHPAALKFISREDFFKTIEEKKALVTDSTTYAEFCWHCSEIIASVHCSHTSMGSFYIEDEMLPMALRFPVQTRWVNNRLFVIDAMNNEQKIKVKDEIESINGKPVADILREIYKHIPAQGHIETTKKYVYNTWSTCLIPYALGFPQTYSLLVKGKKEPILLNKAVRVQHMFNDPSIRRACDKDLCLELLKKQNAAVLTITSFVYYPWNDLHVFTRFIDSSFNVIHSKRIKNLIIDVRFNGGGSSESSMYLLRYLVAKPFVYISNAESNGKPVKDDRMIPQNPMEKRFMGKQFFIMDGIGNSTTGHFMSMVKTLKLGTIVGEECGSNQFCTAGQTTCRLTNTKLVYYVANNVNETTATELPDEKGILPDYYVTQGIDDYINSVDAVKNFTIDLIKK